MSELTYEAIIEAVKKSLDYKPTDNPYVYSHADMHVAILAGIEAERERIIKLLEVGGPVEAIICDYWGDPDFDKDDALVLIEKAIRGENK